MPGMALAFVLVAAYIFGAGSDALDAHEGLGFWVHNAEILLFLVADALLIWGRFGDLAPSGGIFAVLGVTGVLLILTGLIPDAVARATGTPYVSRNQLRFPAAPPEAVSQLAKLNPKATIETR